MCTTEYGMRCYLWFPHRSFFLDKSLHSKTHLHPIPKAHHAARVADACQLWGDVLPNTDAALANALPSCQLHKKQRNSHNQ